MTYFLIEHNRRSGASRVTSFEDREASLRELNLRETVRDKDTDVVLLIAESEANIRITHPRYFSSEETLLNEAESIAARADAAKGLRRLVELDEKP